MIRVLHLFANYKITGPAELALDTALHVDRGGRPGAHAAAPVNTEARFLSSNAPGEPRLLQDLARERNARTADVPGLRLQKHFHPLVALADARRLSRYLDEAPCDILHCHLPNDHMVAALATRWRRRGQPVRIVRTLYDGAAPRANWRSRWLLKKACDHAVCFSEDVRRSLCGSPVNVPAGRVSCVDPPIDTARFDPARKPSLPDFRAAHNIPPEAFVAGIVARMQTHRRFEVLLEAIRRAADRIAGFRFVVMGRGTNQETVAREPVRRMGLEKTVLFTGYLEDDALPAALFALDLKLFLVPGSDGTCRAVREALAAGVPVLAARRGILPQLVDDGVTGRIVDDNPENLARAMIELAERRAELRHLRQAARAAAVARFGYARYAETLQRIYRAVVM